MSPINHLPFNFSTYPSEPPGRGQLGITVTCVLGLALVILGRGRAARAAGGRSVSGVFLPSCLWVSSEVPAAVWSLGSNDPSGRRTSACFRVTSPKGGRLSHAVAKREGAPIPGALESSMLRAHPNTRTDPGAAVLGWPQALDGGYRSQADPGLERDPRHSSFRNAHLCASDIF